MCATENFVPHTHFKYKQTNNIHVKDTFKEVIIERVKVKKKEFFDFNKIIKLYLAKHM